MFVFVTMLLRSDTYELDVTQTHMNEVDMDSNMVVHIKINIHVIVIVAR